MRQPASRELEGIDTVIMGVPFDSGATSFRNGARLGPRRIREASLALWGYNNALDVTPLKVIKMVVYSDVKVEQTSIENTMKIIKTEASCVLASGLKIIALGGDHSITLPLLRAHKKKYGSMAVVHFDAHSDTERGKFNHETPFRGAIEEGLIDTTAYIPVGVRGPTVSDDKLHEARELGARVIMIDEAFKIGIRRVIQTIRELVGDRQVYVSLDIDSVDPAYAPGTVSPEVGGFTSYQMLQLVRGLHGLNFVGFDMVEVSPPYDHSGIISILAANLVFEFFSLLALKKLGK